MKKFIKLFIIPVVLVLTYSCVSDDGSRFQFDNEYGWVEFPSAETTVAVTSRTTTVNIPINFTAPVNASSLVVGYNIVNVDGVPSDVATGFGSSLTISANTNSNSIELNILPTAVATLIANGDIVFDIELTTATRGISVGLSDGSATTVHRVNLLCGGEPQPGTYVIDMHDSYGDGWQTDEASGGAGVTVTLTDVGGTESVVEFGMCSPYGNAAGTFLGSADCTGPASTSFFDATTTVEVGTDIVGAVWNFPGDNWGEISFEIYNPDGSLLFAVTAGRDAGELPVSYCQ
ncbi:hypothetical protein H2O64_14050 [Kordia sp. YSTF-M3]|uniref:DUF1735 domain-containing protein n=1 Tax=Kordia aestuariivivens TaxID=2759037 RepID=A0ABR7QB68_9FLAO|nr:hypothetical protein [Kordia aestuariivivens]MBC8755795.1 hypothetical protein [Kordia aestuariivivens]